MRIDDYLTRLGVSGPLPPTLATLRRLHVAHLGAFPFDNLQIQRRGEVRTDLDSIQNKFFSGSTGGYCFEQNTLLAGALRDLGFHVSTILGRVAMIGPRMLNHLILAVDIEGQRWLADVGFGAEGPLEPVAIIDGIRTLQDGIAYSLRRDGLHWTLSMHYGDASEELYEFADAPHTEADVEMANYYTSTHPASIFRRTLTIQRITPEERLILRPTMVTRYRNGVRTDTPIEPGELRRHARELFGLELGDEPLLFESAR